MNLDNGPHAALMEDGSVVPFATDDEGWSSVESSLSSGVTKASWHPKICSKPLQNGSSLYGCSYTTGAWVSFLVRSI